MEICSPLFRRRRGWLWRQPSQARLDSALETNRRLEQAERRLGGNRSSWPASRRRWPRSAAGSGAREEKILPEEELKIAAKDRIVKQEEIVEEKGE